MSVIDCVRRARHEQTEPRDKKTMCAVEQSDLIEIAARTGAAVVVPKGAILRLVNTHGSQVVDTWAFNAEDMNEYMSMEHSRAYMLKISPEAGDTLVTNQRRPILTLVHDTSPGRHDTLMAACDAPRYRQLGVEGYHDSCTDNLHSALAAQGLKAPLTPSPLNIFMYVPVMESGAISFEAPLSRAGDYVDLRAEMDAVIAMSACPQDITLVNGKQPMPVQYALIA
jgi:uncharacterized protein YcgI (DUF1989 family)